MPTLPYCPRASRRRAIDMRRVPVGRFALSLLALFSCASLLRAQSSLPVITSAATITGVTDQPVNYAITATNSPTNYFACLPLEFGVNPTSGVLSGSPRYPYRQFSGEFYVYATNARGTVGRAVTLDISVPSTPWLSDVTANNNEPLVVGESWAASFTPYDSSGRPITAGLTFSADGLPPGLASSGATIRGTPTTPGTYTVVLRATGAAGTVSRTTVLNVAPAYTALPSRVARVTLPANGVYAANAGCGFQVHFSRPVTITGFPRLAVTVGSATRYATWGGPPLSGGAIAYTELRLVVPFEPGDFDPDGIAVAGSLDLNGGSIKDAEGNNVDVTFTAGDTRGIRVAPVPPIVPQIRAVSETATGLEISGTGAGDVVVSRSGVGELGSVAVDGSGNWSFHYTPASIANGDYTFTARCKLRSALVYSEESAPFTKTISASADTTPPTAAYFTVGSSSPDFRRVTFSLGFNEQVTGLTRDSFTVNASAGGTATITAVGPNGVSNGVAYLIEVSYSGPVGGTVQLALKTAASGIADAAGNAFAGGGVATSESYAIPADKSPPRLSSFALAFNDSAAGVAEMNATFSEPVTGVDAGDFALNTTPNATASIVSVTPAASAFASSWTIRFNYAGTAGSVQMAAKTAGTGIVDQAGNPFQGAGATATAPYAVNNAPPADMRLPGIREFKLGTVSSSRVTFNLMFDEPVSGVSPSAFVVFTTGATTSVVESVTGSGDSYAINVAVSGGAGTVQLLAVGGASANIRDGATHWWNGYASNPPDPKGATDTLSPVCTVSGSGGGGTTPPSTPPPATPPPPTTPPATTPPPAGNPPATTTPPPAGSTRIAQTITFDSPVSAIMVGQPIALGASSSAGLPITYALVSGDATIEGNVLTPRSTATLIVRASSAGSASVDPASNEVNFGVPRKAADAISLAALADTTTVGGPFALPTATTAGLPITYAVSGPARVEGNTLVLTGAAGTVTLRASSPGNDIYSAADDVQRTFAVRALGQQVYLGNAGGNAFAFAISPDNARGVFVTHLAGTGEAIVAKFALRSDGSFSTSATSSTRAARTISGTIASGVATATIAELGTTFTANVQPATGPTASLAELYIANVPGSASGETYIVVGTTGQAFAVAVTPLGATSGTGTIAATGEFSVTTTNGSTIAGTVNPGDGTLRGTLSERNNTAALLGLSEAADRTDRLVNLSSRLRTSDDASRAMIAGFVVTGTEPKPMLVRAIGPGLTAFGVAGALANPRLQIYTSAGSLVAENDDWADNASIAAAADRVGAFKLAAASRDAALLASLPPGAYTAVVSGPGGGVALVELYDASESGRTAAQQLANISTRGFVDTGDGALIAGFVVTGNAPKRVLIRGIGPGLAAFGVPGALADPVLKVYQGATVVAQNDDWATPQSMGPMQTAATAADIAVASRAAGAFPLADAARDAAVIITLAPGTYSAVVTGANNTTGAGLIEVYQLSSL